MCGLNFGDAIDEMKRGERVRRAGWNGKGMWLTLVPGSRIKPMSNSPYERAGLSSEIDILPHIDMFTATGEMQPGWLASQTDILAEDWETI